MNGNAFPTYDVVIVGAGPVGCLCALAHARKGISVALLEANTKTTRRMAGEWLHPPAIQILRELGIELDKQEQSSRGRGFAVLPEDNSDPIILPYSDGAYGLACEHTTIISTLREAVVNQSEIDFISPALVRTIEGQRVIFSQEGDMKSVLAERIIGADGRSSVVRRSLGLPIKPKSMDCSRMVGVTVEGGDLPVEGYGHLSCGGPGPMFLYRLGDERIRVIIDIPMHYWTAGDQVGYLSEIAIRFLPKMLRTAFLESLQKGNFHGAVNTMSPRVSYGNTNQVLIGDAAGHYHPLTAVGMTLGFGDALALAESENFSDFAAKRLQAVHTPELLAMEIYEIFADQRIEMMSVRHSLYRCWRKIPSFRNRTMRLLACEDISIVSMAIVGALILLDTFGTIVPKSFSRLAWLRTRDIIHALVVRLNWLIRGIWKLYRVRRKDGKGSARALDDLARALPNAMPASNGESKPSHPKVYSSSEVVDKALKNASTQLANMQRKDGAWEGELTWYSPMLTAQYVLLHYVLGRPIDSDRRRRILQHFAQTRLPDGSWGMYDHSPPHLFITSLVYVAARVLDTERDDPLIEPAREFLQTENVVNIPTWGKFWLSILNLYKWQGVNAMPPELWSLPRWVPLHPSNWYCHMRLLYAVMAVIYSHRFQVPVNPLIISLREELFPEGFENINFSKARNRLRIGDLCSRPNALLRVIFRFAQIFERFHGKRLRSRCKGRLVRRIQWELQTTSHASISPVCGLLNILALWLQDPNDEDSRRAFESIEGWIWEDEELGTRVAGHRSTSWDTGFSLQALATVRGLDGIEDSVQRGIAFLREQQIRISFEGFEEAYRTDPRGGWCFPGKWHGWPISDCTAEAVSGIIAADPKAMSKQSVVDAVQFMLRCQNPDGGFGSYEPRCSMFDLDWLNPAEIFGECMNEKSYVACTASCLSALATCKTHFPHIANQELDRTISAGGTWLRRVQKKDGSWHGVWGVKFIFGTMFGIRGLIASGIDLGDSAIRMACRWLTDRQRKDGGWGEYHSGGLADHYVPHRESQIIQTAWSLIALLEAEDLNWTAISRGIQFLIDTQNADGTWPKQDMTGVIFRTGLVDYGLYRQYFPLHALGLYEQRRQARQNLATSLSHGDKGTSPDLIMHGTKRNQASLQRIHGY